VGEGGREGGREGRKEGRRFKLLKVDIGKFVGRKQSGQDSCLWVVTGDLS
jgi:hypothetical protein